jgi:hypothetical protein
MTSLRIKLLKIASVALIIGSSLNAVNAEIGSISTRGLVKSGDEVLIGGVIVNNENLTTESEQCFVFRGRGLSVNAFPQLKNPFLTLKKANVTVDSNDDWEDHPFAEAVNSAGLEPGHPDDAALYSCLEPGAYTAIVRSANPGQEGLAIVEIIDAPFYDTSGILSVSLQSDSTQALSGDYLDVADNPDISGNVSWDGSSRTLDVGGETNVIAFWDSLFTVGEKYQVKVNATGMGSEFFTLIADGVELGKVTQNGDTQVYIGPISSEKFQISSSASSTASLQLSIRDAVELTWSANNVTSCTASGYGDWNNYPIPLSGGVADGEALIPIEVSSQQTLDFELSCTDGVKTEVRSRQVNAAFCSDFGPVKLYDWEDLSFQPDGSGWSFPDREGQTAVVSMLPNETVAIRFSTKNASGDELLGAVGTTEQPGFAYNRDITVASCPGQIDNVARGCKTRAVSSGVLYYDIDDQDSSGTRCELDKGSSGETYYFNIKFRDDYCGGNASCNTRVGTF